jgi:hypothetical protein
MLDMNFLTKPMSVDRQIDESAELDSFLPTESRRFPRSKRGISRSSPKSTEVSTTSSIQALANSNCSALSLGQQGTIALRGYPEDRVPP